MSKKSLGITAATFTALFQGLEGVIFMFLGLVVAKAIFVSIGFATAVLTFKEIITFIFLLILVGPKRITKLFKRLKKCSKARIYLYAGVIGTTFGNFFFFVAIALASVSYGVILTALYPVFSMILIRIYFGEKNPWLVWLGSFIAVTGALFFIILPIFMNGGHFNLRRLLGIFFGGCSAFMWAIEGLLINKAMRNIKNKDLTFNDIVFFRSIGTTLTTLFFVMPLFWLSNFQFSILGNSYSILWDLFFNWKAVLILVVLSVNLIFLRNVHIYSIFYIGAKMTAIIDTNNFLVPPLLVIGLQYLNLTYMDLPFDNLFEPVVWWGWLFIIPIIVGVFMVLYFHKKNTFAVLDKIGE